MSDESISVSARLKSFVYLLIISFLVWFALTSTLRLQELLVGLGICLLISLWLSAHYVPLGLPPIGPKRVVFFLIYIVVLLFEIVKANVDVAYRVVHPAMPIKPGIVEIKTELNSDIAKMILANSITLTPGTFTLDVVGDRLLIHWINVKTEDTDEATALIGERFERFLRIVFD
ncbi:MAG: Na+/H+ antiporter subunit E [Planctomycetes bacterium]|nr:Na+/H+ antiporter subunit E [Planctomycetota bacterium]